MLIYREIFIYCKNVSFNYFYIKKIYNIWVLIKLNDKKKLIIKNYKEIELLLM